MPVVPIGMPAAHAEAFQKILAVTLRAWQLDAKLDVKPGKVPAPNGRQAEGGRQPYLARLAARALEAQVMALRCRQAFVGQPG